MNLNRIRKTTPARRFLLTLIPVAAVNIILVYISLLGRSPSIRGVMLVNFLVALILILRFAILFFWSKVE